MFSTVATTKSNIGPISNHTFDRMLSSKVEQIKLVGERITRRIEDVNRKLDADGADASLNNLGELQSLGNEFDRLIAELCAIRTTAHDLVQTIMIDQERARQGK